MRLYSVMAALAACALTAAPALAQPSLQASALPNARSVPVNEPATFFAVITNSGDATAANCRVDLSSFNQAPVSLTYQTADSNLNLTGTPDTPADIAAGASQNFVVGVTPSAAYEGRVQLAYVCDGGVSAPGHPDVNDLLLVASNDAVIPDIITVSLTPSGDGVIRVGSPGAAGVMTIAATWVDAGPAPDRPSAHGGSTIRIWPEIPGYGGLMELEICETDSSSVCIGGRSAFVDIDFDEGEVRTFGVFARAPASGGVPLLPDVVRVRAVFADAPSNDASGPDAPLLSDGTRRSITSQAAEAPAPGDAAVTGEGYYRFRIRDLINDPTGNFQGDGELFVAPDGTALGWVEAIDDFPSFSQVFRLDGTFNPEGQNGPVFGGELSFLTTPDGRTGPSGPFTMRYEPGTGMFGQFDGTGAQTDAPMYFRDSRLQVRGAMMAAYFYATLAMTLDGAYMMFDPVAQQQIGMLTLLGANLSGSMSLGGESCTVQGQLLQTYLIAAFLAAEIVLTQCELAGEYTGFAMFTPSSEAERHLMRLILATQFFGIIAYGQQQAD